MVRKTGCWPRRELVPLVSKQCVYCTIRMSKKAKTVSSARDVDFFFGGGKVSSENLNMKNADHNKQLYN